MVGEYFGGANCIRNYSAKSATPPRSSAPSGVGSQAIGQAQAYCLLDIQSNNKQYILAKGPNALGSAGYVIACPNIYEPNFLSLFRAFSIFLGIDGCPVSTNWASKNAISLSNLSRCKTTSSIDNENRRGVLDWGFMLVGDGSLTTNWLPHFSQLRIVVVCAKERVAPQFLQFIASNFKGILNT